MSIKTCRDCHRELPLTEYHMNRGCRDNLAPNCKDCVKTLRAIWYQKNKDRLLQYSADFYKVNADDVKAYQKRYAKQNPVKIKTRGSRYRANNRERLLISKKVYYEANKVRLRPNRAAYQSAHPEHNRASTYKRRAKLKAAVGTCSAKQIVAKCEYHGWRCYLCGESVTPKTLHMDHRKPIARGGSNWPANLAPACVPCNLSKSNKTEKEYLADKPLSPLFTQFPSNKSRLCP
jgi:5-methylcytosine-specific restriction endonuclease McrA